MMMIKFVHKNLSDENTHSVFGFLELCMVLSSVENKLELEPRGKQFFCHHFKNTENKIS